MKNRFLHKVPNKHKFQNKHKGNFKANCFLRSCVNRRIERMFLWTKYVHDHWINFTHFLNFNLSLFANSEIPKSIQNQIVYDKNVGIWLMSLVGNRFGCVEFRIFSLDFFLRCLPVDNNNKYSKFNTCKSMSYQVHKQNTIVILRLW